MGLDKHTLRFILEARKQGISLNRTATLGRQTLAMFPKEIAALLTAYDKPISAIDAGKFLENGGYIDSLMNHLGVTELTSFDASDYEDATYLHDMNQPIPEKFHEQFDLLIDGGTLEHIFNFPTAIKNALSMVKVGGRFIMFTPTNNAMGHGFYQFSPELMYRVCHPDNGYKIERMHILDLRWDDHATEADKDKVYSKNSTGQKFALLLRRHIHNPLVQKLMWLRYKGFYPGSYSPRYFKRLR